MGSSVLDTGLGPELGKLAAMDPAGTVALGPDIKVIAAVLLDPCDFAGGELAKGFAFARGSEPKSSFFIHDHTEAGAGVQSEQSGDGEKKYHQQQGSDALVPVGAADFEQLRKKEEGDASPQSDRSGGKPEPWGKPFRILFEPWVFRND